MPKKRCSACKELKSLDDFGQNRSTKDGKNHRCRPCARKLRGSDPVGHAEANYRYRQRYPERAREKARRYRERNRDKIRARDRLNYAVKSGAMIRPDACEDCGVTDRPIEAHHRDYSKPLEVRWLCDRCHLVEHGKEARLAA